MHRTALAALLSSALAAAAQPTEQADLAFGVPANVEGDVHVPSATWALLLMDHENVATLTAEGLATTGTLLNFTDTWYARGETDAPLIGGDGIFIPGDGRTIEVPGRLSSSASLGATGPASLYIEAERFSVRFVGMEGQMAAKEENHCLPVHMEHRVRWQYAPRAHEACPEGAHAFVSTASGATLSGQSIRLEATGMRRLEWMGADWACDESSCLPGGGHTTESLRQQGVGNFTNERYSTLRMPLIGGSLALDGRVAGFIVGDSGLEVGVVGSVRLPRAAQDGSVCASACAVDANQTLSITGNFTLAALRPSGDDGRMAATLSGSVVSARVDEAAVEPGALLKGSLLVAAGAGVALVAWMAKILGASLFTRMPGPKALENESRRRIHALVQENPGATFRELVRRADLAAGTVRTHATMLVRSGLIVEHRLRGRSRFFPNEARFKDSWRRAVALWEPALATLHAFIVQEGECPQKRIVDFAETQWSWGRSTTQHRLQCLLRDGVARVREQGRYKFYSATRVPGDPAPPPGFDGLPATDRAPGGTAGNASSGG